jgi:hypothetical protein
MRFIFTALLLLLLYALTVAEYRYDAKIPENQMVTSYLNLRPDDQYRMMILELDRQKKVSKFLIDLNTSIAPGLVSEEIFVTCTMSFIAKERGFEEFVFLKKSLIADRTVVYFGFSNDDPKDVVSEFPDYNDHLTTQDVLNVQTLAPVCVNFPRTATIKYTYSVRLVLIRSLQGLFGPDMSLFHIQLPIPPLEFLGHLIRRIL